MAIVEGLAAKNEVILDVCSDVIALDDKACKGKHSNMYGSIYCPKIDKGIPNKTGGSLSTDTYNPITSGLLGDYWGYIAAYSRIFEDICVLGCIRLGLFDVAQVYSP